MPYTDLPFADRHPDDAALAWFGRPVFQLVDQPLLRFAAWETKSHDEAVDVLGATYYLADERGEFAVIDAHSIGRRLRGLVFSEVPGATRLPPLPARHAALVQHLNQVVTNDRINQADFAPVFASEEWLAELDRWRTELRELAPEPADLEVDDRRVPGIRVAYGGYTGTSVAVGGRIVTLVLHEADARRVDARIVTRPD
jgi:hypothetical protein